MGGGGESGEFFFFLLCTIFKVFFFFFFCLQRLLFGLCQSSHRKWIFLWVLHWLSGCSRQFRAHRLSSCSTRAQFPRGMWDLSYPTRDRSRGLRAVQISCEALGPEESRFKVLIEFVAACFHLFWWFGCNAGMGNLRSLTRRWSHTLAQGQSLNHWTNRGTLRRDLEASSHDMCYRRRQVRASFWLFPFLLTRSRHISKPTKKKSQRHGLQKFLDLFSRCLAKS